MARGFRATGDQALTAANAIEARSIERGLPDTEICWGLAPSPEPLAMSGADALVEAVIDALAYRLIVVECFDRLRWLTRQLEQSRSECATLRGDTKPQATSRRK